MIEWAQVENVMRKAFDGLFLEYSDTTEVGPDQKAIAVLVEVSVDPSYTEDTTSLATPPYSREITATIHWIGLKADALDCGRSLNTAYHRAGELALTEIDGSDITGVQRASQEAGPHADREHYLLGVEVWVFLK